MSRLNKDDIQSVMDGTFYCDAPPSRPKSKKRTRDEFEEDDNEPDLTDMERIKVDMLPPNKLIFNAGKMRKSHYMNNILQYLSTLYYKVVDYREADNSDLKFDLLERFHNLKIQSTEDIEEFQEEVEKDIIPAGMLFQLGDLLARIDFIYEDSLKRDARSLFALNTIVKMDKEFIGLLNEIESDEFELTDSKWIENLNEVMINRVRIYFAKLDALEKQELKKQKRKLGREVKLLF